MLLQCKKCSHFVELEGTAPKRLRCPGCGSALDVSADRVYPQAETVEVESGPPPAKLRRGGKSSVYEAALAPTGAVGKRRPDVFGNYTILDEISRGAMGIVYRAKQTNLNRIVALKLLMAGERASQEQVERFYLETQAVAKLRHPNIIPIYDMGKVENQHYFTMEYVEGRSLEEVIQCGGVSEEQTLDIVEQVGRALAHAHERGIIHRDVKPGNILMDKEGHVRVTDFGLAKEVKTGRKMTKSGVTVGTPHYMSPEQASGFSHKVDQRSDVYSLGAVFYELLTGRPPFDGETPVEVVLKVVQDDPVAPRKLAPRIQKDLETVCMKALDKDSGRRYQTMEEFLADIRRFRGGEPVEARPSTLVYSIRKKLNKHRELSMAISAALIVLSVVFIVLEYRYMRKDRAVIDLRQKLRQTTKRESELREKQERHAAQEQRWKSVFDEPFAQPAMDRWSASGGTWKPLDDYLMMRATEPSRLELKEPLCGNLKANFYFMLDAPLTGHFGLAIAGLQDDEKSGYRILFLPGRLVLFRGDAPKKQVELAIHANRQYELRILRENDFLSVSLDGQEVLSYRDLMPLTGRKCSRLRFLLSGGQVSVAGVVIERESTPLKGSPLIMADRLFMEGEYQSAVDVYRLVVKMPPDKQLAAEALYKMGLCYAQLGSATEALECFKQVSALYEDSRCAKVARLQLGLAYLKRRDYASLQRCIEQYGLEPFMREVLREASHEAVQAYLAQLELPGEEADLEARTGGLREFVLLCSCLPEERRDKEKLAGAHVRLGAALHEGGKYPEAVEACREVLASYPDQFEAAFEARFLLGQTRMAMGDFAAAAASFEEWLKLYPPDAFTRRVVRNVVRSSGRITRVIISNRGWRFMSDYVAKLNQTQRSLALAYVELGKLDETIALVDSIVERLRMGAEGRTVETYLLSRIDRLRRQEHWAQFWKGCVLTMQGAYQAALASFDQAYRLPGPGVGVPRLREGASEEERARLVKQIERAFGMDEETADHNTRVDIMRFVVNLKLGNRAEAFKHLGAAFADNPAYFGPATPDLTAIFAREILPEEIPRIVPENEEAYRYIAGVALFAANRKDEARTFLAPAPARKSWWPYYLTRIELATLDSGGSF